MKKSILIALSTFFVAKVSPSEAQNKEGVANCI